MIRLRGSCWSNFEWIKRGRTTFWICTNENLSRGRACASWKIYFARLDSLLFAIEIWHRIVENNKFDANIPFTAPHIHEQVANPFQELNNFRFPTFDSIALDFDQNLHSEFFFMQQIFYSVIIIICTELNVLERDGRVWWWWKIISNFCHIFSWWIHCLVSSRRMALFSVVGQWIFGIHLFRLNVGIWPCWNSLSNVQMERVHRTKKKWYCISFLSW